MEKHRPSEAHSQTGDSRRRGLSGHGKKLTKLGALTLWRRQKEGFFRPQKETDRAGDTHKLETAEGGTGKYTERN